MDTPEQVPAWPRYELQAAEDGTVTLSGPAAEAGPYPGRREAVEAVARIAGTYLRPARSVRADAIEPDGTVWPLIISPDGEADEAGPARHAKPTRRRQKATPAPPTTTGEQPSEHAQDVQDLLPDPRRPDSPQPLHPAPTPAPAVLPAPDPRTPAPPPAAGTPVDASTPATYARIRHLAEGGQLTEARTLAAALDDATSRAHGPSAPESLQAREVLAHITAENGDTVGAIHLYRDVAERWWHRGLYQEAEQAAGRAHSLWLRIEDPRAALEAGQAVIRMRTQIPGDGARAYRQAARHMESLAASHITRP